MLKRLLIPVVALATSYAHGQGWVGQPIVPSQGTTNLTASFFTAQPPISVTAFAPFGAGSAACGGGPACFSTVQIPLSEFATAAAVSRAQAQLFRGVAMASSLVLEAPLDGKENRFAIGTGAYGNSNAFSVNYSRRRGPYDMGVAASFAGGRALGKASVGVSW